MKILPTIVLIFAVSVAAACASSLDAIGVTLLRAVTTNVDGSGIRVAQPEAGYNQVTNWEVNPVTVGHPSGFVTYISANGSTTNFPNSLSSESSHANGVAGNFYGISSGVATNVAHVDNYDASYFAQGRMIAGNYVFNLPSTNIGDPVVNQSFIFSGATTNEQQALDTAYDNYAAKNNTLFVSGIGNSGRVNPPATCYNGIGVGAYGGNSSYGPTSDNGRCKPDIVAPATETSWSTPYVAGAAALLIQAGLRGDGGSDTNAATDIRTIKALLLNGAIKPIGWTNYPPSPFDTNYGAGVLNVFNSYEQLAGEKNNYVVSTSVNSGDVHPPTGDSGTIGTLSGWDYNSISSSNGGVLSSATDGVNHYFFDVTNGSDNAMFTVTATLVWNRQQNQSGINNLDLFLYDCANSNLVACSTSLVDNVEHIYIPQLAQGRYDLQVWKAAGTTGIPLVSSSETYALAWGFVSPMLTLTNSGTNFSLAWPVYPAGFLAESTTNLSSSANWSTNVSPPVLTNSQNYILLGATNSEQFFRLRRP